MLSGGTDGIDGNSPAAGAVVDGTTVARARERGMSAEAALKGFDAYPLFDALGDAIMTGTQGLMCGMCVCCWRGNNFSEEARHSLFHHMHAIRYAELPAPASSRLTGSSSGSCESLKVP